MTRVALALFVAGCATRPFPASPSSEQAPAPTAPSTAREAEPTPAQSTETAEQRLPEAPAGVPTLPAVSLRSVGLHVGGGPNDADGKAPFVQAIEKRFPDLLRCYRFVSEPGKVGTFGVDLKVAAEGGRAQVEQPRTALAGDEFRACMITAFESIDFPVIKRPTVVSYSLRFNVDS